MSRFHPLPDNSTTHAENLAPAIAQARQSRQTLCGLIYFPLCLCTTDRWRTKASFTNFPICTQLMLQSVTRTVSKWRLSKLFSCYVIHPNESSVARLLTKTCAADSDNTFSETIWSKTNKAKNNPTTNASNKQHMQSMLSFTNYK